MLRDNLAGIIEPMLSSARAYPLALCTDRNESDDRPQDALKIPAPQGGIYTLAENVASPFHAEPAQNRNTRMHFPIYTKLAKDFESLELEDVARILDAGVPRAQSNLHIPLDLPGSMQPNKEVRPT